MKRNYICFTDTPVIEFTHNILQYIQGDNLRFECPVSGWHPKPTNIQWFKDSQALQPSQDNRFVFRSAVMQL